MKKSKHILLKVTAILLIIVAAVLIYLILSTLYKSTANNINETIITTPTLIVEQGDWCGWPECQGTNEQLKKSKNNYPVEKDKIITIKNGSMSKVAIKIYQFSDDELKIGIPQKSGMGESEQAICVIDTNKPDTTNAFWMGSLKEYTIKNNSTKLHLSSCTVDAGYDLYLSYKTKN